jgi:hypothetical protein
MYAACAPCANLALHASSLPLQFRNHSKGVLHMAVKPALEPAPARFLHSTSEEHDSQAPVSEDVFTAPFGNYNYSPSPLRRRQADDDDGARWSAHGRAGLPHQSSNTGLPDQLKSGVENLSGLSLDNVKVHYNSPLPLQLNALAYTQGTEIHVAPGQERHLPHEAWHVVQQKQGRVKPTAQMKDGTDINDDTGLEKEADLMGARTLQMMVGKNTAPSTGQSTSPCSLNVGLSNFKTIQRMKFNNSGNAIEPPTDAWDDVEEASSDTANAEQFETWLQTLDLGRSQNVFHALDALAAPQRHEAIAKSKAMLKISFGHTLDFPNSLLRNIPENQWWKLFIDKGAQNTEHSNSVNALRFDNESSPGYLSAMMKSFSEHVGTVVPGVRDRIGAAKYAEMHRQVAAGTLKQEEGGFIQMPQARSGMDTSFGVLSSPGDVNDHDLNLPSLKGFREMVTEGLTGTKVDMPRGAEPGAGASSLVKYNYQARNSTDARGADYRPITRIYNLGDNFRADTNYDQAGGAALIQGILDRYYVEITAAGTPEQKLQSIVKAIRALHVGHFFEDANGRLNTMTLLNRFLIEEGLQPVIMDSTAIFGGGFSIDQLVGQVVRGMRTFGAVAGIEEGDLPAVDVRRAYQNGDARFVFSEEIVGEGVGGVRQYTIGYTNLPGKAQEIIHHYIALAGNQTGNDTTGKLFFLNPKIAERLEHQLEPQIL